MRQLAESLEETFIVEAFQSSVLRDLINNLKATESWKKNREEFLPHGIAWDKIQDEDIICGESQDPSFTKNFVKSDKYLIIWYPLLDRMTKANYRSRSSDGWYIRKGHTYLTIGKQFIDYDTSKNQWRVRFEAKSDLIPVERGNRDTDDVYRDKVARREIARNAANFAFTDDPGKRFVPSIKNGLGPADGHCTVADLAEKTVSACIAIALTDLAKYSTIELMKERYLSKLNAVAMLRQDVDKSDRWRINNPKKSWYEIPYSEREKLPGGSDYPEIRAANKARYKEMIVAVKGVNILKKYAADMQRFQEVLDSNTETMHVSPLAISGMAAGQFADIYFNRKLAYSKEKADALAQLTGVVGRIVANVESIILITNGTKEPTLGSFYDSRETRIKQSIEKITSDIDREIISGKSLCKIIESK